MTDDAASDDVASSSPSIFTAQALLDYYDKHGPRLAAALGVGPVPLKESATQPDQATRPARYPDPSTVPVKVRLDYPGPALLTPVQSAGMVENLKNDGRPDPVGIDPNLAPKSPPPPGPAASHASSASRSPETLSDEGADFIIGFEGVKNYDPKTDIYRVYDDGYGNPTIGHGHLAPGWDAYPNGINSSQAKDLFKSDSARAVAAVRSRAPIQLEQNQIDALTSLYFNDPWAFHGNTDLMKALKAGDMTAAADAFGEYNTVKKVPNRGLSTRRARERNMFLNGVYDSKH
jgi:lysozyme